MSGGFRMDDYVDVAQRIHDFYERFPDGSLQSADTPFLMHIEGKPFIVYHALAYRTPDDPVPAHGWAWEPVPGPTQFTRDSELMNAETAAWGRAIVACGFSTKKIASAQEVRARQTEHREAAANRSPSPGRAAADTGEFRWPSGKQQGKTLAETPEGYLVWYRDNGPKADIRQRVATWLEENTINELVASGAVPDEDIPF